MWETELKSKQDMIRVLLECKDKEIETLKQNEVYMLE